MLRILCIICIFMLISIDAFSESLLLLRSGRVLSGEIMQEDEITLRLKFADGAEVTLEKDKIIKITNAKYVISTENGSRYIGEIIEETDLIVRVKTEGNLNIEIPKSQIKDRQIQTRFDKLHQRNKSVKSKLENSSWDDNQILKRMDYSLDHFDLGISWHFPIGMNVILGYSSEEFGVRVQGGKLGSVSGFQGNLLINLSQEKSVEMNLGLCLGQVDFGLFNQGNGRKYLTRPNYDNKYSYIGLTLDINIYGIFIETGLFGDINNNLIDEFSRPNVHIAFGYVFRFNEI